MRADSFGNLKISTTDFPSSLDSLIAPTQRHNLTLRKANVVPVDGDFPFVVTGWAADGAAHASASGVYLTIDTKRFVALYGLPRPDVATAIGAPNATLSGFEAIVPAMSIDAGSHTLGIEIVNARGDETYAKQSSVVISVTRSTGPKKK